MTDESKSYLWPPNDKIVVEEMLRDHLSEHWHECSECVKKIIQKWAKDIPPDDREDLVQNVMLRVHHYLPAFRFDCKLTSWLFQIIYTSAIDVHRKRTNMEQFIAPGDPQESVEHETASSPGSIHEQPEDLSILREELSKAVDSLEEYVVTHANPERNRKIVYMVIFQGSSLEQAAKAVGCSAAVAGYIVRSAQRFARERRT
ncbi:MAG TPA: sigma-70 family RNA polymerase sigma factor [Ktedonosporobacter sp.]|nr:sigma-70 family RNA polymerase sigma factor [Ktedonosporobacter sp.]